MFSRIKNLLSKSPDGLAEQELKDIPTLPLKVDPLPDAANIQVRSLINPSETDPIWKELEGEISGLNLPEFTGGVNLGDQRAIFYLTHAIKAKNILEVGTHIGCSTLHFALAMKALGHPDGKLTTVDIRDVNDPIKKPWEGYNSPAAPKELLIKLQCSDWVSFQTSPAIEFMEETDQKFNLVFLDGSHAAADVYREIPAALNVLEPNGILLLHDYFPQGKALWPSKQPILGPYQAIERLKMEGNPVEVIPLGELPWPTKLDTHITSLAILTKSAQ